MGGQNRHKLLFGLISIIIALGGILIGLGGVAAGLGFYLYQPQTGPAADVAALVHQFQTDTSPANRLHSLADLFALGEQQPIYHDKARTLFRTLPPREQLALFAEPTSSARDEDLVMVVQQVYLTLKLASNEQDINASLNQHHNRLLQVMASALKRSVSQTGLKLASEIEGWLSGRQYAARQEYDAARDAYSAAIFINRQNPLTHFERGQVFLALQDYDQALTDFNKAVQLEQSLLAEVVTVKLDEPHLDHALWTRSGQYPYLARLITPPTATAIPTPTISAPTVVAGYTQTPVSAEPAVANIPLPATATAVAIAVPLETATPATVVELAPALAQGGDDTPSEEPTPEPSPTPSPTSSSDVPKGDEGKVHLFLNTPPFVSKSGRIHVELIISNTSDIILTDIVLTDTFSAGTVILPRGFEPDIFGYDNMGTIEWRQSSLGPNSEEKFRWLGTITRDGETPITNTAELAYTFADIPSNRPSQTKEAISYIRPVMLALGIEAPTVIKPGESIVYSVDVVNVGEAAAFDVKVTATIDPNVINPSHISDGGEVVANPVADAGGDRQVIWHIDRLDPGHSRTLSWKGEVDPFIKTEANPTPTVTSNASILSPKKPDDTDLATAEATTRVFAEPVRLILNATLNSYPGGPYASSLTIQNTGHKVSRIVVTQDLPKCVRHPTNISHGGIFEGNHRLVWHLDTLEALETVNLTWEGTVCLNTAVLTDPKTQVITSEATVVIADITQIEKPKAETYLQPLLLFSKTATDQAGPGEMVSYALRVETQGSTQDIDDNNFGVIVIRDPIPANIVNPQNISSPGQIIGNEIVWELSDTNMEAAKPITLTWTGTIDSQTPTGTEIVNTASANDEWGQLVTAEARTMVAPQSVTLDLVASNTVTRGGVISYTVKIQNTGQTTLFDVKMSQPAPNHVTQVMTTSNTGGEVMLPMGEDNTVKWDLPRLDSGAVVELVWQGTLKPPPPAEQTTIPSQATLTTASGLTAQDSEVTTLTP